MGRGKTEYRYRKSGWTKMDCYYLDYFSNPVHFAGHYAAIYGYDHENAF